MEWKSIQSRSTPVRSPVSLHLQNNVHRILPHRHVSTLPSSSFLPLSCPICPLTATLPWLLAPAPLAARAKSALQTPCSGGSKAAGEKQQLGRGAGWRRHLLGSSFDQSRSLVVNMSRYCAFSSPGQGRTRQPLSVRPVCPPAGLCPADFEHQGTRLLAVRSAQYLVF